MAKGVQASPKAKGYGVSIEVPLCNFGAWVIAFGESKESLSYPFTSSPAVPFAFTKGDRRSPLYPCAPVPLYPFGVIASGEGVRASSKAKGYGVKAARVPLRQRRSPRRGIRVQVHRGEGVSVTVGNRCFPYLRFPKAKGVN